MLRNLSMSRRHTWYRRCNKRARYLRICWEAGELLETDHVWCWTFSTHQSISVHAFTLVEPKVNQLLAMHEILRVSLEQALKHIGEVSHVEFVVEVCRCFAEIVADLDSRPRLVMELSRCMCSRALLLHDGVTCVFGRKCHTGVQV